MTEELIKFKTAKLAKEKGFNESCIYIINENETYEVIGIIDSEIENYVTNEYYITAPTQSLLQRWLREVHEIWIYVTPKRVIDVIVWINNFEIRKLKSGDTSHSEWNGYYTTYEESLEAGLLEGLKLIKS